MLAPKALAGCSTVTDYLKKSQKDPVEQSWNPEQQKDGLMEACKTLRSAEIFIKIFILTISQHRYNMSYIAHGT